MSREAATGTGGGALSEATVEALAAALYEAERDARQIEALNTSHPTITVAGAAGGDSFAARFRCSVTSAAGSAAPRHDRPTNYHRTGTPARTEGTPHAR